MSDIDEAIERLTKGFPHYVCEDCWYSCPKSGECCNTQIEDSGKCNCGADDLNADLRFILAEVARLRGAALEEAAKVADASAYYNGNDESRCEVATTIAREIRAITGWKK